MPLHPYWNQIEPNSDAVVWRFLKMPFLRDLMASEELYFRRADKFPQDPNEGVPPDEWLRAVLNIRKFVLDDEIKLSNEKGSLSQFREASYISCWHLFEAEDPEMWKDFAPYGAAVCSRYDLLKAAIEPFLDTVHIGLTRYGYPPTDRYNLFNFIYTKGPSFKREREVRVLMSCYDPVAGINRHIGPTNFPYDRPLKANRLHKWVADGKRRRIDLKSLVTGIVVSPWASTKVVNEVKLWHGLKKLNGDVTRSKLHTKVLPSLKSLKELSLLARA